MATLQKPKNAFVSAVKAGRAVRKKQVEAVSLKRYVSTLAFNGYSPDQIVKAILAVFDVRVVKSGDSTAQTVKQSTLNMWCRVARPRPADGYPGGMKDDGRTARPDSYFNLPDRLVESTNAALGKK